MRLGDGGSKDEFAPVKKMILSILGDWYLPRGYTLVLNGDIEDMRRFWLKDIYAAWPELYAAFDAFAEEGRLRKIVGERDLALLRLLSYPYALSHGLKIESSGSSIIVTHGHQASAPFFGRDYLSDYMVRWLGYPRRPKVEEGRVKDGRKAERRLYQAASSLSSILIEGHTHRPLFESMSRRELTRRAIGDAAGEDFPVVAPCLFCTGHALGARGLRAIELEGSAILQTRWAKLERGATGEEGMRYVRTELRRSALADVFERMAVATKAFVDEP
jgi:predicted phosphodiesterase